MFRCCGMKGPFSLLFYCLLFSTLFMILYSFISQVSNEIGDEEKLDYRLALSRELNAGSPLQRFNGRNILRSMPIRQECPEVPSSYLKYVPENHSELLTEHEKIFAMCKQTKPISVASFFSETMRATLTKIGEGAFADVFGCQKEGWDKLAVKIIPIEGKFKYNGEPQNTFKSIQGEIITSIELSLLGDESRRKDKSILHYTKNFMQINRVAVCTGQYPDFLLEAWDEYDFRKKSDTDRPDMFPDNQLYILLSAMNSGIEVVDFVFHSFEEVISVFQQISATMAVGEAALQFEHRDMHGGNILVRRMHEEFIYFRIDGIEYSIKSYGVMVTIVDYTLSRIKQDGTECTSYVDLNRMPWLFQGTRHSLQYEVYRDLRSYTNSNWKMFHPITNVLWINFLAQDLRTYAELKGISRKMWKARLKPYTSRIRQNKSAKEVFLKVFSSDAIDTISSGQT